MHCDCYDFQHEETANWLLFFLKYIAILLIFMSGLGITMGAHRLWAHRAYKVKLPLKICLLWLQTLASQVSFNL